MRNLHVVVAGAARSGMAAARLLVERGARVTLTDDRRSLDEDLEHELRDTAFALELGGHRPATFAAADLVVVSPGIPLTIDAIAAARDADVPVIGELELASRWLAGRIVAVTGTKGKSTTTTLAGRMFTEGGLRTLVGGNIGTPLSAQVSASTPETFHIVEVSSFQLETVETFHPWIAVLLNLSSDHLDRHGSMAAYGAAKARVFARQDDRDWAVVNADDPQTLALAAAGRARRVLLSASTPLEEGIVVGAGWIRAVGPGVDQPLVPLSSVKLAGHHLLTDVMAAAAAARIAGIAPAAMARAVESFTGLEHAFEPAGVVDGVTFINDSKATNVDAALKAIESVGPRAVVILGGRYKSGDFARLRAPLVENGARVVAIGEAAGIIREALGDQVHVVSPRTFPDAVRRAFEMTRPGGTVLLAPACASFDMFRDYAERGNRFKEAVNTLREEYDRGER